LNFETVLGPGVRPVEWDRIRLFEAMGNDGTSLKSAEAEAPPIFLASDKYVNRWDPKLDISLLVPDSVSRIDRLRFSASGLVSSKERVVEFPGRAGRAERAGLEIEVGAIESEYASIRTLTVKMRTKDVALRRLLPALFNAGMEYKGVSAFTGIRDIQEIEGGVACIVEWYFSLEQMRKGPCRCVGCCSCLHFTDEEIEAAVPQGHPDRLWFNLPDGLEERTVYAEFRDIPLR